LGWKAGDGHGDLKLSLETESSQLELNLNRFLQLAVRQQLSKSPDMGRDAVEVHAL
jgi:hypothetical protein